MEASDSELTGAQRWLRTGHRATLIIAGLVILAFATLLHALALAGLLPSWEAFTEWFGTWWPAALSALALVVAVLVWRVGREPTVVPPQPHPTPPIRASGLSDARWSQIAALVTALAALGALVFTGLSLRTTEQGQVTDRYTKAIDQLGQSGPENLHIRLGGIYALGRLVEDSPRDERTIVEVLTAFIHTTSPRPAAPDPCPHVTADVQAAVIVLTRRDRRQDTMDSLGEIDLRNTCLAGLAAPGADLTYTLFDGADLSGAHLPRARLGGTHFTGARLVKTNLRHAVDTEGFVFLNSADLSGVDLTGADLGSADFTNSSLVGAYLIGVDFGAARLHNSKLANADMSGADLDLASFIGADLTGVRHENTATSRAYRDSTTTGAWW